MPLDIPRCDDPWNLRPYDVPWGPSYYQYTPGKLPGHDGDCLMLRSPTPVEQRRTAIACKHCRQRKAKVRRLGSFVSGRYRTNPRPQCSGDQPACSRCAYSGRKCIYPEERRPQPAIKPSRAGKTARGILSSSFVRRESSISGSSTSTDSSSPRSIKTEQDYDRDAGPYLLFDMASDQLQRWAPSYATDSPRSDYSSAPSTTYCDADYDGVGAPQTYFDYHEPVALLSTPSTMSPAIYAPMPVRPSGAAPGLSESYPHSGVAPQVSADPAHYSYQDPSAQSIVHPGVSAPDSAGPISVSGAPQTFISIAEGAELPAASSLYP